MINISLETHPDLYVDYKKTQDFLYSIKEEDYSYPKEVTNFHVYTEVTTPKELLAIKSYLATQDQEHTKLTVWSDYDILKPNCCFGHPTLEPYKDLIEFRVYDPTELAVGTPLEGLEKYLKPPDDDRHWMMSGIMRFLVLYKFGGIYYDMDMVLLRDFVPILGQNFAYQWGSSTDFAKERRWEPDCHGPCAALMGATKADSGYGPARYSQSCGLRSYFIESCMHQLINTEIRVRSTCFDEDMLGYVYSRNPSLFTVFPSPFFNTEWLISKTDKELSTKVENCWFSERMRSDSENLFLDSFAWHWHNSSNKNKRVMPESKFYWLDARIDHVLREKGIL